MPPAVYDYRADARFVLRAPALPRDMWIDWGTECKDVPALRRQLNAWVQRADVRRALRIASPGLADAVAIWLDAPERPRGRRIERALTRYFGRMCVRATPFGGFAAVSVGHTQPGASKPNAPEASSTRLELKPTDEIALCPRLDHDLLFDLAQSLSRDPELLHCARLSPTTSLYDFSGKLHYTEVQATEKTRQYSVSAVDKSELLEVALARASEAGGASVSEIAAAICNADPEIPVADATSFVEQLVDVQLLDHDFIPPVTGADGLAYLIELLDARAPSHQSVVKLRSLQDSISQLAQCPTDSFAPQHARVLSAAAELRDDVDPAKVLQVDSFRPAADLTLGAEVVKEFERAVDVLHRIGRNTTERDELTRFRRAFVARYNDACVPLLEALDEDRGAGFPRFLNPGASTEPILSKLPFPQPGAPADASRDVAPLLRALRDADRAGSTEIELSKRDIEELEIKERAPLPDAFAISGILAARSLAELDRGRFRLFARNLFGPSGARLLGRFCHLSPELDRLVRDHLAREEELRPEAVFAEIVHLPEERLGNIVQRPVLRTHEIPYLGRSGAGHDQCIPPGDLWLQASGQRFRLYSKRLGREVIPRISCAHNYGLYRNDSAYRFLCMLQSQGVSSECGFRWRGLDTHREFVPRVRFGRLILSLARWTLREDELDELKRATSAEQPESTRFYDLAQQAIAHLRERRRLPRYLTLRDGDQRLPVDLDNALSVDSLVASIRNRGEVVFEEMFPAPEELVATSPDGALAHELVLPFTRREAQSSKTQGSTDSVDSAKTPNRAPLPRVSLREVERFGPGSNWTYARLYCGTLTAERLLSTELPSFIATLEAEQRIDRWFFIRYTDPDFHIRLRLHSAEPDDRRAVQSQLEELCADWLRSGDMWNIDMGTYCPETNRYGGPEALETAERMFHCDSECALDLIRSTRRDPSGDSRFRMALLGANALLADFGLDLESRLDLATRTRNSLAQEHNVGREHNVGPQFWKEVGSRFRSARHELTALLEHLSNNDSETSEPYTSTRKAIQARSARLRPFVTIYRELEAAGQLTQRWPDIVRSFGHMFLNRMFRNHPRAQEMLVYDYLSRLYTIRLRAGK